MAAITIPNLDDDLEAKLRLAAACSGRSMEEEARLILRRELTSPAPSKELGSRIHERFKALDGVELELPERGEQLRAADFRE